MKTIVDEMGNSIIDPSEEGIGAVELVDVVEDKDVKSKRLTDFEVADKVERDWGCPLAFHAGELWSFSLERGWSVASSELLNLCNKIRGGETSRTVFKILTSRFTTPDIENSQETATYWKRESGEWRPFYVDTNQVVFSDGVLDLATNTFQKTDKQVIFGPRITVPYTGMEERCEEFEEMLEYALPDETVRKYLQKLCSLILQPHTILRGQIVFWGIPHSGKTTLATAIGCAPAGLVGASFLTEERIVTGKFASTVLANKFANISNDSEFTKRWESWMKSYTSGTVTVEPKFHKLTSLPATAKMISTCNQMQKMSDDSGASEQRYRVFEFCKAIAETGDTGQSTKMKPEYWTKPDRRAGIIGWMLRGLRMALAEGIKEPESMTASKKSAISESNPLYEWIFNNLKRDVEGFISTNDILERIPDDIEMVTPHSIVAIVKRVWGASKGRKGSKRGFKGLSLI